MEAASISPTPPDKILTIALSLVAILGVAQITGVAIYYIGRNRADYVAPQSKAPAAPDTAPKAAAPPVDQTKVAPVAGQAPRSASVLSVAERLLKDATLLREQGDTANALARLQEAAQSDPKNANVLAQMAMIYESTEQLEKSNDTWRKITEIGPSAGALYELAEMKVKHGIAVPAKDTTGTGAASSSTLEAGTTRSSDAEGIPDGSMIGITELTATETPDPEAETNMKLKISVKVRPGTTIDHTKVKIQVFFYDTMDNQEPVLTDADVSYEWLTPHHDWKNTNPEILAVTYLRPKNKASSDAALTAAAAAITPGSSKKKTAAKKESTAEPPAESVHRKYLGYIVRIYYLDQLQAVRAEPTKLLNLFPPPFTAPVQ